MPQVYQRSPCYDKSTSESRPLLTCTINSPTSPVRLTVADGEVCTETLCQCPALLYGDWGVHALRAHQARHHGLLPALCPLCARERPAAHHFTSSTKRLLPSHSHPHPLGVSHLGVCVWECPSVLNPQPFLCQIILRLRPVCSLVP